LSKAQLIDGKAIAAGIRLDIKAQLELFKKQGLRSPRLAVILVGNDPASEIYVSRKKDTCLSVGIESEVFKHGVNASFSELKATIEKLNADPLVDGILLQLPLPQQFDRVQCVSLIDPSKDVDGITPVSEGLLVWRYPGLYPCTPLGIMELIQSVEPELSGKVAAVVGRSALVGMPMGTLLEGAGCTLIGLHSESKNPMRFTKEADILVVATGVKHLVGKDWVKPGAIVIDVGIHRDGSRLTGDVRFEEVSEIAKAITPVPGGVGPMTIAMLLKNCLYAYSLRNGLNS
jgi:methylenetetrahydrofolate dehydrogenase (NADP+) / methenyltetrahydrofolate cyclohydrolase